MQVKKIIVILYGKEKHESIAEGIKSHIQSFSNAFNVVAIDDESFTPNYTATMKRRLYKFSQRNATWVYKLYSKFNEKKSLRFYRKQRSKNISENKTGTKGEKLKQRVSYVKNILYRFEPFAVVCMTPNALKLTLVVRDMYHFDTKVVSFMSDFGIDLRFLDIRCDKYLVSNDYVKTKLVKNYVDEKNIIVTGVPYASNIKENYNKLDCRKELGIDNDYPLVVIYGGKYGSLSIMDDYRKLLDSICQFNLIALTGGNKNLATFMRTIKVSDSKNVMIQVEADMHKLLTAADILVTVPTTESVLKGMVYDCAVVATNPLSMVEKSNFNYFIKTGIARVGKNGHNTLFAVTELLLEDKERNKLIQSAKKYVNEDNDRETKTMFLLMEEKK